MGVVEWLNDNSGAVLVGLTVAYVIGTFLIVLTSNRTASEQRKARELEHRPQVVAFLENDSERGAAILVIKNVGRSSARGLAVHPDPPLVNPKHPDLSFDSSKALAESGAPIVVPGYEFRALVGTYGSWDAPPHPSPIIRLLYTDESGREFDESYPIDLSPFFDMPASRPKGLHSIAQEMEMLRRAHERVGRDLAALLERDWPTVSCDVEQE